jgi:hypothetical protein
MTAAVQYQLADRLVTRLDVRPWRIDPAKSIADHLPRGLRRFGVSQASQTGIESR